MTAALLELDRVDAFYGSAHILHQLSLAVGGGERVALVGRNGVGKTTVVNTILGLAHTLWMKRGTPVPVKGLAKSEPAASSTTSSEKSSSSKKKPVIDVESTESTSSDDTDDSDGDDSDDSDTGSEASAKTPAKASKSGGGRSKRRGKRR